MKYPEIPFNKLNVSDRILHLLLYEIDYTVIFIDFLREPDRASDI